MLDMTKKRYVIIDEDGVPSLVVDGNALIHMELTQGEKVFEIGQEVKIETSIVPAQKVTYRGDEANFKRAFSITSIQDDHTVVNQDD